MIYGNNGVSVDFIYRQVNKAFERQGGLENAARELIFDALPGIEDHWLAPYRDVAKTGRPQRVENYQKDEDRWFDVYFTKMDDDGHFIATVFNDTTDRKRAEMAARESEERQAFLLKHSDVLRLLDDPDDVADAACRLLVEELHASRAQYTVTIDDTPGAEVAEVRGSRSCLMTGWCSASR